LLQKGPAYSNVVREGPNGRCSKDLTSQFKPRLVGGGERVKEEIKEPKKLGGRRT
jgi:hypothetical protein